MSIIKNSVVRKTLLALGAAATLFAALPSQAADRYCPPPYGHHGDYRHDRYDRRYDNRHDRYGHDRYARYDRRDDWRDRPYNNNDRRGR